MRSALHIVVVWMRFAANLLRYQVRRLSGRRETLIRGVRVPLPASISSRMWRLLLMERYEARESRILLERLEPSDRVLELGAGIGFTATLCARIVGSDSVATVEANPAMLPLIRDVFTRNGVSPDLRNHVVSASGEDMMLNVTSDFWSSSIHERAQVQNRLKVAGRSFESLIDEFEPSVLLIDIEGAEAGLTTEVIGETVRKILVELHAHIVGSDAVTRVRRWIEDQGFAVLEDFGDRSVVYGERR